jgi:hypothetical protein
MRPSRRPEFIVPVGIGLFALIGYFLLRALGL